MRCHLLAESNCYRQLFRDSFDPLYWEVITNILDVPEEADIINFCLEEVSYMVEEDDNDIN